MKKEASKVKQTNKAKQHSTPKAVIFPRKNELPRVGHVESNIVFSTRYLCARHTYIVHVHCLYMQAHVHVHVLYLVELVPAV